MTKIAENLSSIKSKNGIYFISGNHDMWYDGEDRIVETFEKYGLKNLDVKNSKLKINGKDIYLADVS